jgi:hypothetical protein
MNLITQGYIGFFPNLLPFFFQVCTGSREKNA